MGKGYLWVWLFLSLALPLSAQNESPNPAERPIAAVVAERIDREGRASFPSHAVRQGDGISILAGLQVAAAGAAAPGIFTQRLPCTAAILASQGHTTCRPQEVR